MRVPGFTAEATLGPVIWREHYNESFVEAADSKAVIQPMLLPELYRFVRCLIRGGGWNCF